MTLSFNCNSKKSDKGAIIRRIMDEHTADAWQAIKAGEQPTGTLIGKLHAAGLDSQDLNDNWSLIKDLFSVWLR
jgi:hypothetical protein